jgi:hypothetical protein
MKQYKVISLNTTGRHGKVFRHGDVVSEFDFPPGNAEKLCNEKHLELIGGAPGAANNVRVGVLIVTRGDRPLFLAQALKLIKQQTRQADFVEVVDDAPQGNETDVTYRYRIGLERLWRKGAEVAVCMEDDDYYAPRYVERMVDMWAESGRPVLFGIGNTIYYHITLRKYVVLNHPGRASMMCTLISREAKIDWCDDGYAYTDWHLWTKIKTKLKGITVEPAEQLCLGIKHGYGKCGGGGHQLDWARYDRDDADLLFLNLITGNDYSFYETLPIAMQKTPPAKPPVYGIETNSYKELGTGDPFLSFVTRRMVGKRPEGYAKNQQSMLDLAKHDADFEQVFIDDAVGYGMLKANQSFSLVRNVVKGAYIHLLDDDDFIRNPQMVTELKRVAAENNYPDVIFFKYIIKTGSWDNTYPTPEVWGKPEMKFAHFGGGCCVVSAEVYRQYIHHFGHPRGGDFQFISAVLADKPTVAWLDVVMGETWKVSRGRTE